MVMHRPAVTVTFDLLITKSNQHIYEPKWKYICDQNWVKFPSLFSEIWCSQGFSDAQTHSLMDGQTHRFSSMLEALKLISYDYYRRYMFVADNERGISQI